MDEALEKWPNAPLIFVLTAIRISQYPNIEKRIADLHEAVLAQLPERLNAQGFSIALNPGVPTNQPRIEPKTITRLFNREAGLSLFIRDDLIALEVTQYNGFAWAQRTIRELFAAVLSALPNLRPQGVAMRFVDAIVEHDSETVAASVRPGLLGVELPHKLVGLQMTQQFQVSKDHKLTVGLLRTMKETGVLVLPDGLEIPQVLKPDSKLEEFKAHAGEFGLLDFDSGIAYEGPADLDLLMKKLAQVHDVTRDALPLAASELAILRWKGLEK